MRRIILMAVLSLAAAMPRPAAAENDKLPVPRFVSLKADEANLRTGPGIRYPVRWVYRKKWLPVEIVEEFDHWRKIRDVDGESGWVHKSLLSSRRTVFITDKQAVLRKHQEENAPPLLRAERGVIADVIECESRWCRVQIENVKGWAPKTAFWGAYSQEVFD